MRSVFVGTVEISWHCLRTLFEMGEEILAIFTMPDQRAPLISAYRGFDDLGQRHGVPVYKTGDINSHQSISIMRSLEPEIIYVIGWPRLVKRAILDLPSKGCVGIHSSLLPKYRGGAPVNWGLINGETEWGISLLYLDDGPDTGDIIAQERFPITLEDNCKTVYNKATEASIRVLKQFVPLLTQGAAPRKPQDDAQATLYPQRKPHQGEIDWNQTALQVYNWVRALTHPYPGAFTFLPDGRRLFVWQAEIPPHNNSTPVTPQNPKPGTLLTILPGRGIAVQVLKGQLVMEQLQVEGSGEQAADIWAINTNVEAGLRFGVSSPSRT
jgi:methionyl-tRNA formyltransferase